MTRPQIDLMLNDQPMVDYKTDKKKRVKGAKKGAYDVNSISNLREKAARAVARLKEQEDAGTAGLECFEIKGGTSIKM